MLAKIVSNQYSKVYYKSFILLKIINILFTNNDVFLYHLSIVTKNRLYINFQMISDGTVAIIQREIEENKILLFF